MIRLDASTVLLQWATGGLAFLWVTTRHRQVGIGYGWLLRGTYLLLALGGLVVGLGVHPVVGRELGLGGVALAAGAALISSVVRRKAGVSGQIAEHDRRTAQVAAMTGITRQRDGAVATEEGVSAAPAGLTERSETERDGAVATERGIGRGLTERSETERDGAVATERGIGREFNPNLDLVAPVIGVLGLIAAGAAAGGNPALAIARTLVGAAFLGAVSDAMLLGHWYLVQPGLPRRHIVELVKWLAWVWPVEVGLFLVPTGMISVFNGTIDDGWKGMLGWMWIACAVLTIGLCAVTKSALKEKEYSAVMAATGLLYLAILTAFGTDLVARAVLQG